MMKKLHRYKRSMENNDRRLNKRQRVEFKYTNMEKLTPKAFLRKFVDWKANIGRLFVESLYKFTTSSIKLITTHQYIDDKAKTL